MGFDTKKVFASEVRVRACLCVSVCVRSLCFKLRRSFSRALGVEGPIGQLQHSKSLASKAASLSCIHGDNVLFTSHLPDHSAAAFFILSTSRLVLRE